MSSNLLDLAIRFALFFEPILPPFLSFFLRRRLKAFQDRGLIDGYVATTRRIGRFHYIIEVDLELNRRQAERLVKEIFMRRIKTLGR